MGVEQLLERSAERTPDKTALVCGGERCSYRQVDEHANRLAQTLIAGGINSGDRVAVCCGNSIEAVVAIFAVLKAGAAFLVINPQSRPSHIAHLLADSGASALIASATPAVPLGTIKTFHPDASARSTTRPACQGTDQDLAALVYTSGSTGVSKGVMLTHRNLLAAAASICDYLQITADDVILNVLPLAFTYGLGQVTTAFRAGATLVLERSTIYARALIDTIVRERVTGFPLVPTLATLVLQQDLSRESFGHLRYITNAAAALPTCKIERLRDRFPTTKIYSMYGQTECQRASYLPADQLNVRPTSVGIPIPGTSVWIVDDSGRRTLPGAIGELVVCGPHVMRGYWNRPEETARVIGRDHASGARILRTGDLFRMDREGFLYFVDRQDDMIKTRGEKVAPRLIEEIIARLPGVAEVAVYGVPDDLLGEAIAASIALAPGEQLTRAGVQRHCFEYLDSFMVPQIIDIRDVLPTSPNGKVSRLALRAAIARREVSA